MFPYSITSGHRACLRNTVFNFWNFYTITQWLSTCKRQPTPLPQSKPTGVIHCLTHLPLFLKLLYLFNWTQCTFFHNREFVTFLSLRIFSIKSLKLQSVTCWRLQNFVKLIKSSYSARLQTTGPDDGWGPKPYHAKCNAPLSGPYRTVLLQIYVHNDKIPWYSTYRSTHSPHYYHYFQLVI